MHGSDQRVHRPTLGWIVSMLHHLQHGFRRLLARAWNMASQFKGLVKGPIMDEKLAERLAQAALRGFFGTQEGFRDMKTDRLNRAAVKAVEKVLQDDSQEVRGIGDGSS